MMTRRLKLTNGMTTLVDADIAEKIGSRKLRFHANKYAYLTSGKTEYLHRWIMNATKGQIVDHINGNGLDNRRCNLRIVTNRENQANRRSFYAVSGYRGVYLRKQRRARKWRAAVQCHKMYRRSFFSRYVAALFVDRTLRQLWDVPGYLNYPFEVRIPDLHQLIFSSMGSWMTMVFSKKSDGRLRVMECRIMGTDNPPPPECWKDNHQDLIFVWERDKGVKAVPKENILCLLINGLKYHVARPRCTHQ